mmetsp:Transcript_24969/g.63312  ORF Transcript_24969/g.63312 Transcript_24969/m.63312 type:complete len:223 (+) Transcript_24969:580-1248(+)
MRTLGDLVHEEGVQQRGAQQRVDRVARLDAVERLLHLPLHLRLVELRRVLPPASLARRYFVLGEPPLQNHLHVMVVQEPAGDDLPLELLGRHDGEADQAQRVAEEPLHVLDRRGDALLRALLLRPRVARAEQEILRTIEPLQADDLSEHLHLSVPEVVRADDRLGLLLDAPPASPPNLVGVVLGEPHEAVVQDLAELHLHLRESAGDVRGCLLVGRFELGGD